MGWSRRKRGKEETEGQSEVGNGTEGASFTLLFMLEKEWELQSGQTSSCEACDIDSRRTRTGTFFSSLSLDLFVMDLIDIQEL